MATASKAVTHFMVWRMEFIVDVVLNVYHVPLSGWGTTEGCLQRHAGNT